MPAAGGREATDKAFASMGEEARRGAVVRRHRTTLTRLNRIVAKLARRLERRLAEDAPNGAGGGASPVQTLDTLTRAAAKLIPLERQAFGIENGGGEGSDADDSLTDAERAHRIAVILQAARERRDRPPVDGGDGGLAADSRAAGPGL